MNGDVNVSADLDFIDDGVKAELPISKEAKMMFLYRCVNIFVLFLILFFDKSEVMRIVIWVDWVLCVLSDFMFYALSK